MLILSLLTQIINNPP